MDSFAVVSQWRSGSTLTALHLNKYLTFKYRVTKQVVFAKNDIITNFCPQTVYHTHNLYNVQLIPDYCTIVRNKRDLVDSVISKMVAEEINMHTHYNNKEVKLENYISFKLEDFEKEFYTLWNYEKAADNIFRERKHYVIEYNDIEDDPNNIFKILGINYEPRNFVDIPTKINLDYKTIISNYSELIDFAISKNWR